MKCVSGFLILLLICSLRTESEAQGNIKGFWRLSGPEKCWTIRHLFVAGRAFRITKEARGATVEILRDSLLDQYPNGGQADAFRHIYWMARLTQRIGPKKAKSLGIAHEKGNYKSFLKGENEDGAQPDSVSGLMDLTNNQSGILIGKSNDTVDVKQVKLLVVNFIKEGNAVILKRNTAGRFVGCNGEIVEAKKEWRLPYCLIKSNEK